MQALASTRPHNFNRVIKPEEKQLLQGVLETAFGVQRKKSMKNAVAKKTVRTKKTPAAPHQAKRTSKKLS
jgi:hypothetical protein